MALKPLFFAAVLSLTACATSAPVKAPAKSPTVDKDASAAVKAPAKDEEAEESVSTAPVVVDLEEMGRIDPGAQLADVLKAFNEKSYSEGAALLDDSHLVAARRGQGEIDYELQVYAMRAHAFNMMGDTDAAAAMYRRVLSKWTNLGNMAYKLRKADPEHGDERVARALDAFSEALFFVGERKRARVELIDMPYNDVGDAPPEMKRFIDKPLVQWLRRRQLAITAAETDYLKVNDVKPGTPQRWVMASHARIGSMYAEALEELKSVAVPAGWEEKGESEHKGPDGKPMSWEQIREAHAAQMAKLMDPLRDKAVKHFSACAEIAEANQLEGAFPKSCTKWLKANE
jgi:hypothetical protein